MSTPKFKSRVQPKIETSKDWKDRPLPIAVGVAVGTSIFFMTVVLPLRVDLLTAKVERLTELSASAVLISNELERTKKELAETRAALQEKMQSSPFHGKSVYPTGFDAVVLGSAMDDVVKRYPDGKWDEDKAYYSVKSRMVGLISQATYYFMDNKVSFISFHVNHEAAVASEIIRKHFLTTFGEPDAIRKNNSLWKATDREWVVVSSMGSFDLYSPNAGVPTFQFRLQKPPAK